MSIRRPVPVTALLVALIAGSLAHAAPAPATCDVADAGIEALIAKSPTLREAANAQVVRDLRTLRDAAIVLETYQRPAECRRLVALVRKLAANPGVAVEASGDTDEEAAERVAESREPKAAETKASETKGAETKGAETKGAETKRPETPSRP